ncbi:putative CAAX prenyl protease 1 [Alteracholeplasma palmae J233]|uniref:Putative CAAX prenyl protease 1 n=1 Tax=Alteracholeplasma palmae (strain ATCC 49389 / J233) TaxID=1318466 RepID=U4KNY0_ALTPJ|nr:M48 family metallopeptidase [Alteracholeplasma palmae]CCV63910.1 putative CAAX prenyl protease 1 [Alteracholeplasma palmae J233]
MKIFILSLIALVFVINIFMSILDLKSRKRVIAKSVSDVYDKDEYTNWRNYQKDSTTLGIVSGIVSLIITAVLFYFNIFSKIYYWTTDLTNILIFQVYLFILVISLISVFFDTVISYYDTFILEEKYGMNKTSKKLFIKDTIVKFLLKVVFFGLLLYVLNIIYVSFENPFIFFITAFSSIAVLVLLMPYLQPIFSRIFNKATSLEEGSLKDKINAYANKMNFPVENIYVIDASKRSSRSNAYFSGYGKKRRIVLYDTLISEFSEEEIVAILAHEVGHAKHKDILKRIPMSLFVIGFFLISLYIIASNKDISLAFGFTESNFLFSIMVFIEIMPLTIIIINTITNWFSRKMEYAADKYSVTTYSKEYLVSALKKLSRKNLSNLAPHPITVVINYTHPPLDKRIEAIENI